MSALKLSGITKRFGGLAALSNVSFTVNRGEVVGLIGPNGAGKTTLFNVVSGFETFDGGQVELNDSSIGGLPPEQLARRGMVRTFQLARPFGQLTVLENLMIGAFSATVIDHGGEFDEAEARAHSIAERIGLEGWLNVRANTLPYGTLKLLEVGRVLSLKPSVVLLDEPFAGISGSEAEHLVSVLAQLAGPDVTMVIIEHKLKLLMRLVERVLVLSGGCLIADGSPASVVQNEDVCKAYLGDRHNAFDA